MITDVAVTGAQAEMLELCHPEQIPITGVISRWHTTSVSAFTPRPARHGSWLCWHRCGREAGWSWSCGSGLLTRELTSAGHRVVAADASPAMLQLARGYAPQADVRQLTLPADPLPEADAVVSVGHVLSYLPDQQAIVAALTAIVRPLRPGGLFAVDICDVAYGQARRDSPPLGRAGED